MTNPYPSYPHPPHGYGAPGSGMPPGSPYAQVPNPQYRRMSRTRPPLTRAQKRAALWAGAIGFPLMSLGFSTVVTLLGWSALAGLVAGIASQADHKDADTLNMLADLEVARGYWWVFALVLVVGLLIWGAGYGASIGIAKAGRVNKATGVTWAGLGIASCAGFILMWLGQILFAVGGFFVAILDTDAAGLNFAIYTIVFLVLGTVIWGVAGAMSWWWMAHCMRARHPAQRYAGEPYFI